MSENKDSLSYRRSLVVTPRTSTQFNQFLPTKDKQSGYVPAPLRKKRAERHDDNRRSWASPMFTEEDGTFSRSKSMSDITVEQVTKQVQHEQVTKQVQYEQLQKIRAAVKENEDKWQDDLSKWKNRRRSVNSDIMKKKEEREQIEVLTSGSSTRKSKTLKEMAEERKNREPGSYKSRFSAYSTSEDQDVFEEPAPSARSILSRSYTIDNPYTLGGRPMVPSLPSLSDEEPIAGSLASDEADSPTSPLPTSSENQVTMSSSSKENQTSITSHSLLDDPVPSSITSRPSLAEPTSSSRSSSTSSPPLEPSNSSSSNSKPVENSSSSISPVPEPRRPYGRLEGDQSQTFLYKPNSVETKQPGVARVSASLPRSYQRSDSARLTSVVTPRPFSTQTNRIASLPRAYTMDDSHKRFNGETESSKKPTVPSRYAPFMKEDEAHSQTSSAHSSDEGEGEEEEEEQVAPATQTSSSVIPVSHVSPQPKAVSPVINTQQESYSDMRISLNQKPKSSHDFGFQSAWDSTGAHVKSIQPGSPAELCHLQVGDEILAVNGHKVADMSYEQWKSSMDEALQRGSLLIDIRRHGKNSPPETHLNPSLNFTHPIVDTTVRTLNVSSQLGKNLPSNGINGGIPEEPVTLRNKESEPISLKNLKRRSEFFEQGGSETAIPDLPVPSLSAPSNRWSWDPEEERRRQEKWQKEQERQLQEKYRRDQEKLEEEFRKAQQEALNEGTKQYEEEMRNLELEQLSVSSHSPLSPLSQASPPLEEQEASRLALQEEDRRRKEEENQRLAEEKRRKEEQQHLEEEKRRREQQKRLEEERRRREEQERLEEERRRREQQKRLEEEKKREEEERQRKEEERQRKEEEERRRQEAQQRLQEKAKSKSTPELDELDKTDIKGVYRRHRGLAGWLLEEELRRKKDPHILKQQAASELELERRRILSAMKYRNPERAVSGGLGEKKESLSQAELERQQIIQEMKKKTQLLTDSSWIRQRSPTSSTSKEPVSLPMRRGESLDNLDSSRPSWRSSWTPGSTSSIPDYSRPQSALSGSSYYNSGRPASATLPASQSWSTSSIPAQLPKTNAQRESQPLSQNRSVSGKKICTFCDMPLGKGAAMIIESLGLCYHLPCFKCVECKTDLGGSEAGAEVRIRNKQLYCNTCYMRVKNGQPTDM